MLLFFLCLTFVTAEQYAVVNQPVADYVFEYVSGAFKIRGPMPNYYIMEGITEDCQTESPGKIQISVNVRANTHF